MKGKKAIAEVLIFLMLIGNIISLMPTVKATQFSFYQLTVLDESNTPIVAALVTLSDNNGYIISDYTNVNGVAAFSITPTQNVNVHVEKPNMDDVITYFLTNDAYNYLTVHMSMYYHYYRVTVYDNNNALLVGALVTVYYSGGEISDYTGAYGYAAFSLHGYLNMPFKVQAPYYAEYNGHFSTNTNYNNYETAHLTLAGQTFNWYRVTVLDENNEPITAALVTVGGISSYTNQYGNADFSLIPQSNYEVDVIKPEYQDFNGFFATNNAQNYLTVHMIPVIPTDIFHWYRVTVYGDNNQPLNAALVTCGVGSNQISSYTNQYGNADFSILSIENLAVIVEAPYYVSYSGHFTTNNDQNYLTVHLLKGAVTDIKIKIVDKNSSLTIQGAGVRLGSHGRQLTNATGEVLFPFITYGGYTVYVDATNYYSATVIIIVNSLNKDFTIQLQHQAIISAEIKTPPMVFVNATGYYYRNETSIKLVHTLGAEENVTAWEFDSPYKTFQIDGLNNLHYAYTILNTTDYLRYVYYTNSTDRGLSWSTPLRLNPVGFNMYIDTLALDRWNNLDILNTYYNGTYSRVYDMILSNTTKTFSTHTLNIGNGYNSDPVMAYDISGVRHYTFNNYTDSEMYYYNSTNYTPIKISNFTNNTRVYENNEDFESTLSNWYGYYSVPDWDQPVQGISITTAQHYSGSKSLTFQQGIGELNAINQTQTRTNDLIVEFAIRFNGHINLGKTFTVFTEYSTLGGQNNYIDYGGAYFEYGNGANNQKLEFEYGGWAGFLVDNITTINSNEWYKIKYHVKLDGDNSSIEGYVNDVLVASKYNIALNEFVFDGEPNGWESKSSVHTWVNKNMFSDDLVYLDSFKAWANETAIPSWWRIETTDNNHQYIITQNEDSKNDTINVMIGTKGLFTAPITIKSLPISDGMYIRDVFTTDGSTVSLSYLTNTQLHYMPSVSYLIDNIIVTANHIHYPQFTKSAVTNQPIALYYNSTDNIAFSLSMSEHSITTNTWSYTHENVTSDNLFTLAFRRFKAIDYTPPLDTNTELIELRRFFLIAGFFFLLTPSVCWSIGSEYRSLQGIGIGLISMFVGLCFLASITSF